MNSKILVVSAIVFAVSACQKPVSDANVKSPLFKKFFATQPKDELVALFRQDSFSLFGETKLDHQLVMVSFARDSFTAGQLESDPNVWYYYSGAERDVGHALVELVNPDDLDFYARLAHASDGFACGNLTHIGYPLATVQDAPAGPVYEEHIALAAVRSILGQTDPDNLQASIAELVNLGTRFHSTTSGRATPDTVEGLFESAAGTYPGIKIEQVSHGSKTAQNSVVVTLPGSDSAAPVVIMGAHLDSTSRTSNDDAPGADDDASGVATLVEIARILTASNAKFARTIELHAYGAEEIGLVGSEDIAVKYRNEGRKVAAMFQIDMNGYAKIASSETIYLVTTDTNAILRQSLKDLMNSYLGGDFQEKPLASGSSDHRSWTRAGYPAVFPFEDPATGGFNPNIHTATDTFANMNTFSLTERFTKLGLSFVAHYAGLTSAASEYQGKLASSTLSSDLQLAIIDESDSGGGQFTIRVGVGASPDIETVELCKTGSDGDATCHSGALAAPFVESRGERRLFLSELGIAFATGDSMVVFGYAEDGSIKAERRVTVTRK